MTVRGLNLEQDHRQRLEQRIRLSLGRHSSRITEAQVRISPVRAVGVREAVRCEVVVWFVDGTNLHLDEKGHDAITATGWAAWKLDQRLERHRMQARNIHQRA
jgi:ribosome-associated translation inhibitor RaiA